MVALRVFWFAASWDARDENLGGQKSLQFSKSFLLSKVHKRIEPVVLASDRRAAFDEEWSSGCRSGGISQGLARVKMPAGVTEPWQLVSHSYLLQVSIIPWDGIVWILGNPRPSVQTMPTLNSNLPLANIDVCRKHSMSHQQKGNLLTEYLISVSAHNPWRRGNFFEMNLRTNQTVANALNQLHF